MVAKCPSRAISDRRSASSQHAELVAVVKMKQLVLHYGIHGRNSFQVTPSVLVNTGECLACTNTNFQGQQQLLPSTIVQASKYSTSRDVLQHCSFSTSTSDRQAPSRRLCRFSTQWKKENIIVSLPRKTCKHY